MSVARLDLDGIWDAENSAPTENVSVTTVAYHRLVRQIGAGRKPAICPECRSIIYSRRHRLCGVCGQPLPDHLLFSVMEAQRVEQLLERERSRHRRWLQARRSGPELSE